MKTLAIAAFFVATTASAAPLSVGGSYPTQVSLIDGRNTCGAVQIQDNTTTVTQTPGEHTLSLTHAGNAYQGTIDDSGNFSTTPHVLTFGSTQYTIAMDGAFTTTGFTATVTLDVRQPVAPTTCAYAVKWQGTKQGGANSIPVEPRDGRALVVRHYVETGDDSFPIGLAMDRSGNLYVAAGDFTIKKITRAGVVSVFAGVAGQAGFRDGSRNDARFAGLHGIVVDSHGNLFVTDNPNHAVRKIAPDGNVTTFVGNGSSGSADGTGSAARLNFPHDLAIDASDNLYVADVANQIIRKITPAGVMTTLAGRAGVRGNTDGRGSAALFEFPSSMAVDASGNVWVGGNGLIRKIAPDGTVTTIASGFEGPEGLEFGRSGELYISSGNTIQRLDTNLHVTTVAGMTGRSGDAEGIGAGARLALPLGVAVNPEGRIFIADAQNDRIFSAIPDNLTCTDSATQLCLNANRFSVTLHARDQRSENEGDGLPHKVNPIFGYFSIPALTGNDQNPEVFVKVLDGRPVNGAFWVFYGGLTDLDYTLNVLDTVTGLAVAFVHDPGSKCGDFDTGSLPAPASFTASATSCAADSLCLLNSRFRVTLHARDQRSGREGEGVPLTGTSDLFGYFSLPALTGDANNAEVFLKILDGRTINGKFWVFYGGLTDLEYTITVTDAETGAVVRFTHPPGSKCGDFNTSAF